MRFAPIFFSYGLVTVLYADETIKRWDGPKGGKISHGGNNIGNGDGGGLKIDTGGGDIGDIGVGGGGGGCNPDACDDKCQRQGNESGYCYNGSESPNLLGLKLGQSSMSCICIPKHCDSSSGCNGQCCASGLTCCDGTCVDLESNTRNCGSCRNTCSTGSICSSGRCTCTEFPGFQPQTTFPVGYFPYAITVGDLNNDGKLDIATVNRGGGPGDSVSVLLGTGSGGFLPQTAYPVGAGPTDVVFGDFNKDGNLDIAAANYNGGTVSILLGDGSGNFNPQTTFPVMGVPNSLAVGDFDEDGKLDIVAAIGLNAVSLLLGDGSGSFGPPILFTAGPTTVGIAVDDLNADGHLDVVVTNQNDNTVSVLLGTGTGDFLTQTAYTVGTGPISVNVGDFNEDGNLDIVTTNISGDTVSVLLGTGDGTFGAQTTFPAGPQPFGITLGDVNDDGYLDIVTANSGGGSNSVSVLLGTGSGTFELQEHFAVGPQPLDVAVGDFNKDGYLDIVASNYETNSVSLLLGKPCGT